jgi:hypothetical protein
MVVPRFLRNGVQLRATLWDGFVGSNVGFFADRDRPEEVGVAVVRQRGLVLLWIALREHEGEPPSQLFDRVGDRSGLVFVVATERYAIEERFGLGRSCRSPGGASMAPISSCPTTSRN